MKVVNRLNVKLSCGYRARVPELEKELGNGSSSRAGSPKIQKAWERSATTPFSFYLKPWF